MKIGLYFECYKKSGGVYQVALNHLEALKEITEHEFLIFNISPDFPYKEYANLPNWKIIELVNFSVNNPEIDNDMPRGVRVDLRFKRKVVLLTLDTLRFFHLYRLENFITRFKARKRAKIFNNYDLDLLLFLGSSELSLFTKIPSVVIIHDLNHKLAKEFPEMSGKGQWSKREYVFKRIDKNAFKIYVDSEVGKEDTVRLYNIDPKKIVILRPLPPPYIKNEVTKQELDNVVKKYNLPEKFLFYPAQFWPHKNHFNLIQAVKELKDKEIIVPLVFVGSAKELWGEYKRIVDYVEKFNLKNQIYFLGYAPVEDISPLYKLATGLIMPVYVGWTYVPIVEAWAMECPIIYSKTRGCPEQAGNSALYVDPYKPEDIAEKIKEFWDNPSLRAKLVENGQKRLALWTKSDFNTTIKNVINEFERKKFNTR